jgi:ParB family chromosome partitioning protein
MAQQYGLGRGLASLIPPKNQNAAPEKDANKKVLASGTLEPRTLRLQEEASDSGERILQIPVANIVPNPHQPRLHFDQEKLAEMAKSIQEHGILQPLVVTRVDAQNYELIAGERRFQAAKIVGLKTVPALVREAGEQMKLELAIIENVQRHNLNPIEEAKAYARLVNEFSLSQEEVAEKMGKKRSTVANTLRLLHLPVEIQRAVAEGRISEGHAKALLAIENKEKQRAIFELILKEELTVRETESRVKSVSAKGQTRSAKSLAPEIAEASSELMNRFGTKVKIAPSGRGGKIIFEYFSDEELSGLLGKLKS